MSKNLLIKNTISKNYFKNNLYLGDKIRLNKIIKNIFNRLDDNKNNLHILSKKLDLQLNQRILKKFSKYKSVIVLGMGGSILGSQAIYNFLKEKINKDFLFFDNLDQEKIEKIKKNINLKKNLFLIISKSGNTLETLINSNLFQDDINNKNTIIITEKKTNLLNTFAKKKKILHINHKDYIGGRFSVLSEVGMVPAYFMNLKIKHFRKYLLDLFKSKKNKLLIDSVVKLSHVYNLKKINSIIFLNYAPELNNFLYWCQQLMAESLGKSGKGILPVVSQVPRDHHSLLQLYLDGPKDKLFYIFSSNLEKKMKIKKNIFGRTFGFIKNKELSKVREAQKKALLQVLKNKNIPYREFKISRKNEEVLGELFSYFILETILVGEMIGVNPYDQPAVEEVKILTKKHLS